jgi:hypothetical protein
VVDPIRRSAARTATLVAVPVTLVVLFGSLLFYGGLGDGDPQPAATGPVTMATRDLGAEATGICQAVIANLPDEVLGHARRPVSAGTEQNAAYGDPAITVECGATMPTFSPTDTSDVIIHDGVCWHPVAGDDSAAWTTVNRIVAVTVTVPGTDGSGEIASAFSVVIRDNDPERAAEELPTGCVG